MHATSVHPDMNFAKPLNTREDCCVIMTTSATQTDKALISNVLACLCQLTLLNPCVLYSQRHVAYMVTYDPGTKRLCLLVQTVWCHITASEYNLYHREWMLRYSIHLCLLAVLCVMMRRANVAIVTPLQLQKIKTVFISRAHLQSTSKQLKLCVLQLIWL